MNQSLLTLLACCHLYNSPLPPNSQLSLFTFQWHSVLNSDTTADLQGGSRTHSSSLLLRGQTGPVCGDVEAGWEGDQCWQSSGQEGWPVQAAAQWGQQLWPGDWGHWCGGQQWVPVWGGHPGPVHQHHPQAGGDGGPAGEQEGGVLYCGVLRCKPRRAESGWGTVRTTDWGVLPMDNQIQGLSGQRRWGCMF